MSIGNKLPAEIDEFIAKHKQRS